MNPIIHLPLAQGFAGTKTDVVKAPTGSAPAVGTPGLLEFVQLGIALTLVAMLLKWGLPKLMGKAKAMKASGSGLIVESMTPCGAGHLVVAQLDGRRFLIGSAPQSMNLLAELWRETNSPEPAAFFEMLDEKSAEPAPATPTHAVVEMEVEDDSLSEADALALLEAAKRRAGIADTPAPKRRSEDDDILAALDRISKLTGK